MAYSPTCQGVTAGSAQWDFIALAPYLRLLDQYEYCARALNDLVARCVGPANRTLKPGPGVQGECQADSVVARSLRTSWTPDQTDPSQSAAGKSPAMQWGISCLIQ